MNKQTTIRPALLLKMMNESPAVKAMTPEEVFDAVQIALEPASDKAERLFSLLVEEKKRMAHIEDEFRKITDEAMDEFRYGLLDIQKKSLKRKMAEKEKTEDKGADNLLKKIK